MKKFLRDQWVAKLRSGEIKQVRGTYKNKVGCCVIGVLLDIVDEEREDLGDHYFFPSMRNGAALEAYGISRPIGEELVYLNDGEGLTFKEIADKIEEIVPVEE